MTVNANTVNPNPKDNVEAPAVHPAEQSANPDARFMQTSAGGTSVIDRKTQRIYKLAESRDDLTSLVQAVNEAVGPFRSGQ